jgi:hypothetical protein
MMIIGCDFHPSWQQIAWSDSATGEAGDQKLVHGGLAHPSIKPTKAAPPSANFRGWETMLSTF